MNTGDITIGQALSQTPGVAQVTIFGARRNSPSASRPIRKPRRHAACRLKT